MLWYSPLLKKIPWFAVIHTVKGFSVLKEAEVFWNSLSFFWDPVNIVNLVSASSAFSKTRLNIWRFMVHVLLKPGLENFEHYFTSM